MDEAGVPRWLTDYVEAWRSSDPAAIGKLFSEDALYRRYLEDDGSTVESEFRNVFLVVFDNEGRCREFAEHYMKRPD